MASRRSSAKIGTWPTPEDKVVNVKIPRSVLGDLRKFQRVQATILDRLGCGACCSGYDIRWDVIREFSIDEKLNVREIAGGVIVTEG